MPQTTVDSSTITPASFGMPEKLIKGEPQDYHATKGVYFCNFISSTAAEECTSETSAENLEMLKICLTTGEVPADTRVDDNDNTALHYAAATGNEEAIDILLQHGAAPQLTNKDSQTPYDVASHAIRVKFPRLSPSSGISCTLF